MVTISPVGLRPALAADLLSRPCPPRPLPLTPVLFLRRKVGPKAAAARLQHRALRPSRRTSRFTCRISVHPLPLPYRPRCRRILARRDPLPPRLSFNGRRRAPISAICSCSDRWATRAGMPRARNTGVRSPISNWINRWARSSKYPHASTTSPSTVT